MPGTGNTNECQNKKGFFFPKGPKTKMSSLKAFIISNCQ